MWIFIVAAVVAFSQAYGLTVPAQGSDPCKGTYSGANCYSNSEIKPIADLFGKTLINGGPCFMSTSGILKGKATCFVRVTIVDGSVSVGYEACHDPTICKFGDGSGGGGGDDTKTTTPAPPPPPPPQGCKLVELDSNDIKAIVDKHNALRAAASAGDSWTNPVTKVTNVTLSAATTPIQNLAWDTDLAKGAVAWAKGCPDWNAGHDSNADRQRESNKDGYVGQNMAWSWAPSYNPNYPLANHIQGWYDEIKFMSDTEVKSYPGKGFSLGVIGHYTQVVWANTNAVGCAKAQWPKNGQYYELLLCNYYPGGNWKGQSVYPI